MSKADLAATKSTDPRKVALASLLWSHTTVSQNWLAERLHLRSAANVSQLLRRANLMPSGKTLPPQLREFQKNARENPMP